MSNSVDRPGKVAGGPLRDFEVPINPVDQLRCKIRMMQDCLSRMSDATELDLLGQAELSYLNQQLTHLGNFYVGATQIVTGVTMCAKIAQDDVSTWSSEEIAAMMLHDGAEPAKGGEA